MREAFNPHSGKSRVVHHLALAEITENEEIVLKNTVLFEDLNFEPHYNWADVTQAKIFFDNGYGASVITGEAVDAPYELAVLVGTSDEYSRSLRTHRHIHTEADVERYLQNIAGLPKAQEK
jgi:hypothetical protein